MNRRRVDDPALKRSVGPGPTWRLKSANESRTIVRRHSIDVSSALWRTRPEPALESTRPGSCWLMLPLEMLELTNATQSPRNENVSQASTHSCTQMLISTTRRSRLDVPPPSTGLRRGPTARHRRTIDRSSATADGRSNSPSRVGRRTQCFLTGDGMSCWPPDSVSGNPATAGRQRAHVSHNSE